jgi:Ricin-type beta-trefoil lectin domain-like
MEAFMNTNLITRFTLSAIAFSALLIGCGQKPAELPTLNATARAMAVTEDTYKIVNVNSGKLLDVSGGSREDEATVLQWADSNASNQWWKVIRLENGYFKLENVNSGKVLDVSALSKDDGAKVQQWGFWQAGTNQQWKFLDVENGAVEIQNVNSDKVLDGSAASQSDGASVQQWTSWGGDNQKWKLVPVSSGGTPTPPAPTPPSPPSSSNLDPAYSDSWLSENEAFPEGVPTYYSWYRNAAQPGWMNSPPLDWFAMTNWGQVYTTDGYHPDGSNTRVQIRDVGTWIKSKATGQWTQAQFSTNPEGGAFNSDFGNNGGRGVSTKDESANGGGISVTAGNGFNYHFWSAGGRASINPGDIAALYAKFEARLVLDNPNGTDDRAATHYIASAGMDYWRDTTAGWKSDWSNNGGVTGGIFKRVTNDWKVFSASTIKVSELTVNPPPLR